jgi:hypothetical protein
MRGIVCAGAAVVATATLATIAAAGLSTGPRTTITIWSQGTATPLNAAAYGGAGYGGVNLTPTGALVVEDREVDVPADGQLRLAGIAGKLDPGSIQVRSLTEPTAQVSEQRFVPGAESPTDILAHHVGDQVVVVTPKGDVPGVLRAVDATTLVLEVGTGDQRHLQLMRRDGFVQDIRLPPGAALDKPGLALRLAVKKPGKQTLELAYRTEAMTWSADYLAVLDDAGTVDFSAWATIDNQTGAAFDDAEVTLVGGGTPAPAVVNAYGMPAPQPARPGTQARYVLPGRARLGANEQVQVELVPPRTNIKAATTVIADLMPGQLDEEVAGQFQADCTTLFNGSTEPTAKLDTTLEIDVPTQTPLPDGKVRLFRRHGTGISGGGAGHLEVLSEDQLRSAAGVARVPIAAADNDLKVARTQGACNYDEAKHRLDEHLEIELESTATRPLDVVVRETMWRAATWKIDPGDENMKGTKAGPRFHEWRVRLAPKEKKTIAYTVAYLQ